MNKKISELVKSTRKVFLDSQTMSGAIFSAPSHKNYYPQHAKNYGYCWPRDSYYILLAADILGIDLHSLYLKWIMKAEPRGLFLKNYTHKGKQYEKAIQIDQTASVILSLLLHKRKLNLKQISYLKKCAEYICNLWDKDHFSVPIEDLWEERTAFPDLKENFTYSLAACIEALQYLYKYDKNELYKITFTEMLNTLKSCKKNYYPRSYGKFMDDSIDASTLCLVWPFDVIDINAKIKNTVNLVEKEITKNFGVHRYKKDVYDGWMFKDIPRNKGAGYWPLLNFWMAIVKLKMGDRKKAIRYYNQVLNDLDDNYIPEQIFSNKFQVAVKPLAWSHAMFILASKELGFI